MSRAGGVAMDEAIVSDSETAGFWSGLPGWADEALFKMLITLIWIFRGASSAPP